MGEFLHFDIQSTGQKSHCVNTVLQPSQCYVLIKQSDSPSHCRFQVRRSRSLCPPDLSGGRRGLDFPRPDRPVQPSGNGQTRNEEGASGQRPEVTRRLEPILVPKLRIQFADFPYPHYSIGQRLLTSETCCGHEYDRTPTPAHALPRIFKDRRWPAGRRLSRDALPDLPPSRRTSRFQGRRTVKKKRQLFPAPPPASPGSLASPPPPSAERRGGGRAGSGILTRFPFDHLACYYQDFLRISPRS